MTFNGSWGYMPYAPAEEWHTSRAVLNMVRQAAAGCGNLLLNIGPKPDGSVPEEAIERLVPVGKWLAKNGEAVYGKMDRANELEWMPTGQWTRKGNTGYFWCSRWPEGRIVLGGLKSKLKRATLLASGKEVAFEQSRDQLIFKGLPKASPDKFAEVTVLKLEFASTPRQVLGMGHVVI